MPLTPEPTPQEMRETAPRVAVTLVAAAILVFWFLPTDFEGAHRRRELQRVREDLVALSRTIDAYLTDEGCLPPAQPGFEAPQQLARFQAHKNGDLPSFTAEAQHALLDFYSGSTNERHYEAPLRFVPRGRSYLLASRGPDRDWNREPGMGSQEPFDAARPPLPLLLGTYDPTNGTHSPGDLWVIGPR